MGRIFFLYFEFVHRFFNLVFISSSFFATSNVTSIKHPYCLQSVVKFKDLVAFTSHFIVKHFLKKILSIFFFILLALSFLTFLICHTFDICMPICPFSQAKHLMVFSKSYVTNPFSTFKTFTCVKYKSRQRNKKCSLRMIQNYKC